MRTASSLRGVAFALLIALSSALLVGCGGGGAPALLSVTGFVLDAGMLTPLAGAQVSAQGQTATTQANGFFSLTGLTRSPVTLTLTAAAHEPTQVTAAVSGGAQNLGNLYLAPTHQPGTGTVRGQVRMNGLPSPGATIAAGTCQARSDAGGNFTLYNAPPGLQILTASNSGGAAVGLAAVHVPADGVVTGVVINLTSGPPPPPL